MLKLKLPKETFSRRIVGEMWLYPDGSRIFELSTKCLPAEGLNVAVEARKFLEGKGIDLSGQQQTKTKAALTFFSAELMAERLSNSALPQELAELLIGEICGRDARDQA